MRLSHSPDPADRAASIARVVRGRARAALASRILARGAMVVGVLAFVGCGGDGGGTLAPVEPTTPIAGTSATLAVLGQGAVAARFTSELTVRPPWAYTGTWGRRGTVLGSVVYVWDVSGAAPVLRDSVQVDPDPASATITTIGDVQVTDDGRWLVVATEPVGSLVVYSLADPARPALVARYSTPELAAGVHTAQVSRVNGTLYAFCALDPRGAAPARLAVVDLSDPTAPRQVLVQRLGDPYVHDTYVRDGWLLTANWNGGVTVWDIGARGRGTPAAPDSVGTVRTVGGQAHNVWWGRDATGAPSRWAFVGEEGPGVIGSGSSGDVHVVDMADPARPREVAVYSVPGAGTHNFAVDEAAGILYAAYYNAGVRAIDVRGDLSACTGPARMADGRCDLARMGREIGRGLATGAYVWGVEVAGGALYASDMLNGLWKLGALTR
jgi:hypothetical protein